MNDKTGKQLAAAISELAKAIDRLAASSRRSGPMAVVPFYPGGNSGGYTITATGGGGGAGGVGGSPGGVHPRTGGGGNAGAGGAALTMVGEAGPEYFSIPPDVISRSA